MEFLEFLNRNSGAFNVLFTAVVAIATVVYAILTWRLVSETIQMRQVQTDPTVSITIEPREEWINLIDLVIQNIGKGPAHDIRFELQGDFEYKTGKFLSELNLMREGLQYLAPNQTFRFFLTSMVESPESKLDHSFAVRVSYLDGSGRPYYAEYKIRFSEWKGLSRLGEPPLHKMARSIDKIRQDIEHLATGFNRMKVVTYTRADIKAEEKEWSDRFKEGHDGEQATRGE